MDVFHPWVAADTGTGPALSTHGPRIPDRSAHLAEVALTYVEALADGRNTVDAIVERFTVSESTARRWVSMARDEGWLTPTEPGRAGGELTPEARQKLGLPEEDDR